MHTDGMKFCLRTQLKSLGALFSDYIYNVNVEKFKADRKRF